MLLDQGSRCRAPAAVVKDNDLIGEFLETGNNDLFAELVERYQSRVLRLVSSVLGPKLTRDAQDVVQEAFVRVFRNLPRFRAASSFSTWLYRIAYNAAVDHRRRLVRQHQLLDSDGSLGPVAETSNLSAEERLAVFNAVEDLPDPYRTALFLHYWHGSSLAEIGELLGARPNTVKTYLFRGRQRLGKTLRGEDQ